jgi:ferrous iron transport protein A
VAVRLSELTKGAVAVVQTVEFLGSGDRIAQRLENLGFVAGESLRVLALGPWGSEPMLVRIGNTRFALRMAEAARVMISVPQ